MPRFAGVPPNMSVAISTPSGPPDRLDRRGDLVARVLDVLVPADRHRRKVRQVADDGLGGVDELGGELSVGHDHDANHAPPFPSERRDDAPAP